jgi:hypothetical protein
LIKKGIFCIMDFFVSGLPSHIQAILKERFVKKLQTTSESVINS